MTYYHERDGVNEKVASLAVTVEERYGKLYSVAECQVKGQLTSVELERLKDYLTGQYSDGLGEGFEQRPIQTAEGELYVHLWQDTDYFVRTEQELTEARGPKVRKLPQRHRGGEAR